MATLKELAAYTGLSVTTISRILNDDPSMSASAETRKRVIDAAGELGYKKKKKSTAERLLRFGLAEMLLPAQQLEDPYYLYLRNYVAQECIERHIELVQLPPEDGGFAVPAGTELDGIIAIGIFDDRQIESLESACGKIVFLDSAPDEVRTDAVVINFRIGIELALHHLWELGHIEIGFIGPSEKLDDRKQPAPEKRWLLFTEMMQAHGAFDERYMIDVPTSAAETVAAVKKFIGEGRRLPTAFITANEENAIGAVRAMNELGIRIPEEISVISFNDTPLSELFVPPLTSVSTHVRDMSRLAVNMLCDRVRKKHYIRNIPVKVTVPPTLAVRSSTAAPGR